MFGNGEQPSGELRICFVAARSFPHADEGTLGDVFCICSVAHHAVCKGIHGLLVALNELAHGLLALFTAKQQHQLLVSGVITMLLFLLHTLQSETPEINSCCNKTVCLQGLLFVLALGADKLHFLAQNGTNAVFGQIHLRYAHP